jgi:hypothetical protein
VVLVVIPVVVVVGPLPGVMAGEVLVFLDLLPRTVSKVLVVVVDSTTYYTPHHTGVVKMVLMVAVDSSRCASMLKTGVTV